MAIMTLIFVLFQGAKAILSKYMGQTKYSNFDKLVSKECRSSNSLVLVCNVPFKLLSLLFVWEESFGDFNWQPSFVILLYCLRNFQHQQSEKQQKIISSMILSLHYTNFKFFSIRNLDKNRDWSGPNYWSNQCHATQSPDLHYHQTI